MTVKKLAALLFSFLLILAFAACGGDDPADGQSSDDVQGGGNSSTPGNSGNGPGYTRPSNAVLVFPGADYEGANGTTVPYTLPTTTGAQGQADLATRTYSTSQLVGGSSSLKLASVAPLTGNLGAYWSAQQMVSREGKTKITFWWRGQATGNAAKFCIALGPLNEGVSGNTNPFLYIDDATATYAASAWDTSGEGAFGSTKPLVNVATWTKVTATLPTALSTTGQYFKIRLGRNATARPTGWELYFDEVLFEP
ncbi:MAG: hypothetical protein LBC99_05060 [Spirochaetota bacterium]|nr:hypothetical protein [Spirochaetota bacterium]